MQKQTVMIFGGTSGIGFAIAKRVTAGGASLIITGRNPEKLAKATYDLSKSGASVTGHIADTADRPGLEKLFAALPPIDHFVSMAGGFTPGGFLRAPEADVRHGLEEKLFANMILARLVVPHLTDNSSMTFTAGADGSPQDAAGPFAGNAAIRTLVQGLAADLAPHIRVNAVAPIFTRTELWRDIPAKKVEAIAAELARKVPMGRIASPDEVAGAYLFLMENSFITGQTIVMDGGLSLPQ